MIQPRGPIRLQPHSLDDPAAATPESGCEEHPSGHASRFSEIAVCLDGSELGDGVVPHAQLVAQALGSRMTLLRVLECDQTEGALADPLDWGIRQRQARAELEALQTEASAVAAGVQTQLIQGRAAEQICQWAGQHDVDLTILCSHGARGLTDWNLASTARKLIERLPRSFLLVPARAARAAPPLRYRRILVPLDGSSRSESVLPVALRLAAASDAEVVLVHIVPTPELTRIGPLDVEGIELERRVVERNRRVANDYLARVRSRVRQAGTRVRNLVLHDGSVGERLDQVIRKENADIVIMSAHGCSERIESPCGGITEYVLTHADVPIFVVREDSRHRMRRARVPRERATPRHSPAPSTPESLAG